MKREKERALHPQVAHGQSGVYNGDRMSEEYPVFSPGGERNKEEVKIKKEGYHAVWEKRGKYSTEIDCIKNT